MTKQEKKQQAEQVLSEIKAGGYTKLNAFIPFDPSIKLVAYNEILSADTSFVVPYACSRANVKVLNTSAIGAANRHRDNKVGILNFASAWKPGGGWLNGAEAQEEHITRHSTLYASIGLNPEAKVFYQTQHRNPSGYNTDAMLISPNVTVYRDYIGDNVYLNKPFNVCCITCAAVDYRSSPNYETPDRKTGNMHMRARIAAVLQEFYKLGCRNIVLGAWGCGVFQNNPMDIARLFHLELYENGWIYAFDNVIFAIKANKGSDVLETFRTVLCFKNTQSNI